MRFSQFFADSAELRFPKSTLEGLCKGAVLAALIAIPVDLSADTSDEEKYLAVSAKVLLIYLVGISLGALCGKIGGVCTASSRARLQRPSPHQSVEAGLNSTEGEAPVLRALDLLRPRRL